MPWVSANASRPTIPRWSARHHYPSRTCSTRWPWAGATKKPSPRSRAAWDDSPAAPLPKKWRLSGRHQAAALSATLPPGWWTRSTQKNSLKRRGRDRKSTRLNSSHMSISYAVFCLKKKKKKEHHKHKTKQQLKQHNNPNSHEK